jgi:hypothetical protein
VNFKNKKQHAVRINIELWKFNVNKKLMSLYDEVIIIVVINSPLTNSQIYIHALKSSSWERPELYKLMRSENHLYGEA